MRMNPNVYSPSKPLETVGYRLEAASIARQFEMMRRQNRALENLAAALAEEDERTDAGEKRPTDA